MKRTGAVLLAVVALGVAARAQVALTSLDRGGNLTWTNALSNGTYRVEWAGSLAGPWQRFDALTNLTLLSATTNVVTVQVPMFYRVVWVDAPPYAGTYEYRGYDAEDVLAVTGRLYLWGANGEVSGVRDFQLAPGYTKKVGPQIGSGRVGGGMGPTYLSLNFDPKTTADEGDVLAGGWLVGDDWLGSWFWTGWPYARGTFRAVRLNAVDSTRPPSLSGAWEYRGGTAEDGTVVTGQVAFATATNPIVGTWSFARIDSSVAPKHQVGEGAFTEGVLSGSGLWIPIRDDAEGSFWLEGEMSGDLWAGFWHWRSPTNSETYTFWGRRQSSR